MSNAAIITIAVAVVVVLGAVSLINLARHSDLRGAGALSEESLRRDRQRRRESREFETEATGQGAALPPRDVEAGGAVSRGFGVALVTVDHNSELVRWVAPESDAVGVSRRQFFNRASVTLMGVGMGGFAVAAFVGFLWPAGPGGFGGVVSVGKLDAVKRSVKENGGFFYIPEARSWITEYPSEALAAAETTYPANLLEAMESGIVVLSQKCHTSAAVCRSVRRVSGSSVSATVRSTTVSVRKRRVQPPVAWIVSRPPSRPAVTS